MAMGYDELKKMNRGDIMLPEYIPHTCSQAAAAWAAGGVKSGDPTNTMVSSSNSFHVVWILMGIWTEMIALGPAAI